MKVVLELQDQPSNIKKVTIRHDVVIGRGAECNLRLSAPQVSRRHCFLRVNADGASVTDLDSSNGTWLDDEKLSSGKRYQLEDGMMISVGPVKFIARVRTEAPVAEALQVDVQDERVEAEFIEPLDGGAGDGDMDATISGPLSDVDHANMNFAIEQAGEAASEDEPTADYVPTSESGDYFAGIDEIEDDEPETVHDDLSGEVVDVVDAEVAEVIDAEVDFIDDGELIEADELIDADDGVEEVDLVDDDEMILADDEVDLIDDEIELVDEVDDSVVSGSGEIEVIDDIEDDEIIELPAAEDDKLNNFLKGLD